MFKIPLTFLTSLLTLLTLPTASVSNQSTLSSVSPSSVAIPLSEDRLLSQLETGVKTLKINNDILRFQIKFPRILKKGMRGKDVKELQQNLNNYLSDFSADFITGYFGPATTNAIKEIQTKANLEPTGILDSATRDSFGQTLATQTLSHFETLDQIKSLQNLIKGSLSSSTASASEVSNTESNSNNCDFTNTSNSPTDSTSVDNTPGTFVGPLTPITNSPTPTALPTANSNPTPTPTTTSTLSPSPSPTPKHK